MDLNNLKVQPGQVWRNNKNGKNYKVVALGRHTETFEIMVSYTDVDGNLWFRPYDLFLEKFTEVS